MTSKEMATPGNIGSHHVVHRYVCDSASIVPHEGIGRGTPSPRKPSEDSRITAVPNCSVRQHEQTVHEVRQDMASNDVPPTAPGDRGEAHKIHLRCLQHFTPQDAGVEHPPGEANNEDDVREAGAQNGDRGDRHHQVRQCQKPVSNAHQHPIHPALQEAGQYRDECTDDPGHEDGQNTNGDGNPRTIDQAAQEVAPLMIRPQRMSDAWRRQGVGKVGFDGVIGG